MLLLLSVWITLGAFFMEHTTSTYYLPDIEYLALYDLYNSTNGDEWTWSGDSQDGIPWRFSPSANPCADRWQGVNCSVASSPPNTAHVSRIHLLNTNLRGSLPDSLSNLGGLELLRLRTNFLTGPIPSSIGSLTNLVVLDFSYNGLTGQIPNSVGNLIQLRILGVNVNRLSGSIPASIGDLFQLDIIDLQGNYLTNSIPESVGKLSNLRILDFSENELSHTIPSSMGDLDNLIYFGLDANKLTGSIPESIGNLVNLRQLFLYQNNFNGSIPSSIGNLINLPELDLSTNKLSGTIPSSLGNLNLMFSLDLSGNKLSGTIPESFGDLENLQWLFLSTNNLNGTIPEALGYLYLLQVLDCRVNRLSGRLPDTLGNLTQLQVLELSNNTLTGPAPDFFGRTPNVYFIALGFNALTGTTPQSTQHLPQLQYLLLDSNRLVGTIPAFVCTAWPDLVNLVVSNNFLTGTIPTTIADCPLLFNLQLNGNLLSGTIPPSVGQLPLLEYLHLFENNLNGTIPASLGKLEKVMNIDLDQNQLSGTIPSSIGNLTQLKVLQVGSNHLSGTIPEMFTKLYALQFLVLSNNRLSGSIPQTIAYNYPLIKLELSTNDLTGTIPHAICNLTLLKDFVLYVNQLTGTIPNCVGNLPLLQMFYLYNNSLTGSIPCSVGPLKNLLWVNMNNNQLTGPLPSFESRPLILIHMSNNSLSGTLPSSIRNLTSLISLEFQGNHFDGPLSHVFSAAQSSMINIRLDGSQFTGTVPSVLFEMPSLLSVSLVGCCLHGSLPDNICHATQLEALILYGLTTGASCRERGGLQPQKSFGGAFPSCLLALPNMVTLLMSSNDLTGSIAGDVVVSQKLLQLDLSHNRLTGSIPKSIQNITWSLLYLSHNKLNGVLDANMLQSKRNATLLRSITSLLLNGTEYSTNATADPSLTLLSNRLSGPVPSSLMPLQDLSVLAGNLFECKYDKSNLPQQDRDLSTYECASNAFDAAIYAWLGLSVCALAAIVALLYSRRGAAQGGALGAFWEFLRGLTASIRLPDELSARLTSLHSLLDNFQVLSKVAWCCAAFCLVVLLPYYAIVSHYEGTHTYQYAYVLSAIYTSGVLPFVFDVLLLSLLVSLCCYCYDMVGKFNRVEVPGTEDANHHITWLRSAVWCVFALTNITVTLGANIGFIYIVLYESSDVLTAAQVLLSLFKLFWSMVASPFMIRQIDAYFMPNGEGPAESFFVLQLLVALFNNIAIPCLVVAAIDPNCFSNILLPPDAKVVDYLLPGCLNTMAGQPCTGLFYRPASLQFTPPFTYSYQCSASFITSYAPTFIYMSISTVFLNPALQFVLLRLFERLPAGSIAHRMVSKVLPRILQPLSPGIPSAADYRHNPLIGCTGTLVTVLTQLGILLTFGAIFPPVALAMAVSLTMVVYTTMCRVQMLVYRAVEAQQLEYLAVIQAEAASVATNEQLQLAVVIVICYCCAFYTLFLFDTLGDAVGFDASVWVPIVVPLAPCLSWVVTEALRKYKRAQYISTIRAKAAPPEEQRQEIELGVVKEEKSLQESDEEASSTIKNVLHVRNV